MNHQTKENVLFISGIDTNVGKTVATGMIAKALAQSTPILFLDEPTAFLDYPSKAEMLQLLRSLAHDLGKTIFLSTHDIEMALQLSDHLKLMQSGRFETDFR